MAALRPHVVVVCITVVSVDVVVLGVGGDLVIIGGVVSAQPGQKTQGRWGGGQWVSFGPKVLILSPRVFLDRGGLNKSGLGISGYKILIIFR